MNGIPKIIHFCWFGKKSKGTLVEECVQSWKRILPDFEICEWHEHNYSSDSFFFNYCMSEKKFAFASDYARFDILKKYGGIYLDTDMLVIKPFEKLLANDCFFGYEYEELHVSCGIIGAVANHPFIGSVKKLLDSVRSPEFFQKYTIVQCVNEVYSKAKEAGDIPLPKVYPLDYFYPYPYGANGDPLSYKTNNTIAIHMWNASWLNDYHRAELLLLQGKKAQARNLFLKALLKRPHYIRFFRKFI